MKIFLIGLPGAGKTTLGKVLAARVKIPFVDLDEIVEKSETSSVAEIFKNQGENYFREVESKMLKKWCEADTDFVMATGGGTPCFFDNIKPMNASGITLFLDVPASEIARRIMASGQDSRPLFATLDKYALKDKIEFLRSQRLPYYKQSKFTIQGVEISLEEVIKKLEGKP